MMECGAYVGLYFKSCCWVLFIKKKKKSTSVLIDNPSAASSPSFPAHLHSPSVTLLFSLIAVCNAALEHCCQVYKYNNKSGKELERTRKRCNYNIWWHNLCILIHFWGGSWVYLGCGCMCFQLLGLCTGTCIIYADLLSSLGVCICICVDLRSHGVDSQIKAQTWRFCCPISTIIFSCFCMTKAD